MVFLIATKLDNRPYTLRHPKERSIFIIQSVILNSFNEFLEKEGYISLSDSARTPSRIFITTSQKALYNYGIKDKTIGKSIEVLLRSYTGLFDDFQTINESLLAQRIQVERKTLVYHFHQLHKMELLVYREQTETPWVTFTEDVALPQNLHISPKNYHNLKVISNQRLDAFIHLVEAKNQCRNTIILDYFKVDSKGDCGICDVCISKRKAEFDQEKFIDMKSKILDMHSNSISYEKIIESFSSNIKEDAVNLISYMKDEGLL